MEIHKGTKTKQDLKLRGIQHFYMSDNDVIQKLKRGEIREKACQGEHPIHFASVCYKIKLHLI